MVKRSRQPVFLSQCRQPAGCVFPKMTKLRRVGILNNISCRFELLTLAESKPIPCDGTLPLDEEKVVIHSRQLMLKCLPLGHESIS